MKRLTKSQMRMIVGGRMACMSCGPTTNDVKCVQPRSGWECETHQSGDHPSGNVIQCSNQGTMETQYINCDS